jgi:hypothetical protein
MLAVRWPAPLPAQDHAAFAVALAQATPALAEPEVLATLRAVEARRPAAPSATALWRRLQGRQAVLHGDFHPGNLLYEAGPLFAALGVELQDDDDRGEGQEAGEEVGEEALLAIALARPPVLAPPVLAPSALGSARAPGPEPTPEEADGGEAGRMAACTLDFQHWGRGAVAFELAYFVCHARALWALPAAAIPAVLGAYLGAAGGPGTVLELLEELLAVMVEWTASFLADDTFESRPGKPNPAPSPQAMAVKPAAPTGDEVEDGAQDGRLAPPLPHVLTTLWGAPRELLGGARHSLVWAWHQSAMLQLASDLLHREWGARESALGRRLRGLPAAA